MRQQTKRILVVEDEDSIRTLLFTVLRRRGFGVDTARNGIEALQRCRSCRYGVVLLDMMMPLLDGNGFLEEMSRHEGERPIVIVMTAAGVSHYFDPDLVAATIRKPFDVELMVDTIRACLYSLPDRNQPDDCPPAESDGASDSFRPGEPN